MTDALEPPADDVGGTSTVRLFDLLTGGAVLGGLSERQMRQLIYDGELRLVKLGRLSRVRSDDIAAYIERHTTEPAA